jgi:hypothetical protein
MGPITGLDDAERRNILPSSGLELQPLDRPARSQSLYQLPYPVFHIWLIYLFICDLFNIAVSTSGYIALNGRMNKEAVMAHFRVLSWNSPGGAEENHKITQSG